MGTSTPENLSALDRRIERIYEAAVKEAARLSVSITDFSPDKPFSFSDYPITRKRIEKLLDGLKSGLSSAIINGVNSAWTLSNNKNNELARQVFGDNVGNSLRLNTAVISPRTMKPVKRSSPERQTV